MMTIVVWLMLLGALICFIFKARVAGHILWIGAMIISVARLALIVGLATSS